MPVIHGVDTNGNWPLAAAAMLLPSATVLTCPGRLDQGGWIGAMELPILLAHQTEEWVMPGGFLPFVNRRVLGSSRSDWPLTRRVGFHVNVTLGWASAAAGGLLWRRLPAIAVAVLWLEVGNVALHGGTAVRERRYNPGLATATGLMAPHAVAGLVEVHRRRLLARHAAWLAAGAGLGAGVALPVLMRLRMGRRRRCLRLSS